MAAAEGASGGGGRGPSHWSRLSRPQHNEYGSAECGNVLELSEIPPRRVAHIINEMHDNGYLSRMRQEELLRLGWEPEGFCGPTWENHVAAGCYSVTRQQIHDWRDGGRVGYEPC